MSDEKRIPLPTANAESSKESAPSPAPEAGPVAIDGVRNIIAVASGKGGVGKSTIAVNLALALAGSGKKVGICDADIYGPSIPMMLGVQDKPMMSPNEQILPVEKHDLKIMSIGFLVDADTPVIWRGPMVMKMVTEFLRKVAWGDLDYLVLDLPPGTGDAQLTIVQTVPLDGAIIVTTPNDIALADARRGLAMFQKVSTPILGVVENMSFFECPHCQEKTPIFDSGGGKRTAQELKVPFLGEIPIHSEIRKGGDEGKPVVLASPGSTQSRAFLNLAESVQAKLSRP